MGILQKEAELQEVVQLVGYDALPEKEKSVLDIAKMIREDFLQQSAFDEIDTYCSLQKQYMMLNAIMHMSKLQSEALEKGVTMTMLQGVPSREKISRMKEAKEDTVKKYYEELMVEMEQQVAGLAGGH
jgi:V/A-type H+-transporting ATPase subunit A